MQSPITRPLILHRWGGLGNHRYQVGFSGDVIPVSMCVPYRYHRPTFKCVVKRLCLHVFKEVANASSHLNVGLRYHDCVKV